MTLSFRLLCLYGKVKSAYKPSGCSGWDYLWFQSREVTRFYSPLPPRWGQSITGLSPVPSIKFARTHIYTWFKRDTEHHTLSLGRAQTRTTQSRGEQSDLEATTLCQYGRRQILLRKVVHIS